MPIFIWGDDPSLRWPHLKCPARTLSTVREVPRTEWYFDFELREHMPRTTMVEVPDPTEWVQTSRRFHGVQNTKTGEHRDIGREAFELFKERGGQISTGGALEYQLQRRDITTMKKSYRPMIEAASAEGWSLGYHGVTTRDLNGWVSIEMGIWAHIGCLFRFMFNEEAEG